MNCFINVVRQGLGFPFVHLKKKKKKRLLTFFLLFFTLFLLQLCQLGSSYCTCVILFCIRLRFQRSHTVPCFLVGFTWKQECRRHAPLGSLRQRTHACTAMGVHHHVQQWLTRAHTHTHEGITAHACTTIYTNKNT